jgi:hypothetical protein
MDEDVKTTIDASVEVIPQNPFTMDIQNEKSSENIAYPGFPVNPENDKKAGVLETAASEFRQASSDYSALHYSQLNPPEKPTPVMQYLSPDIGNNFAYKAPPPGWTPKQEIEKLSDIDPKYMPRLLAARNPQDFQYRLDDIYQQQRDDKVLENGSTFGKILGGLVGYSPIGSIENFIPLAAIASKAKIASGFIEGATKNIPGLLGASAIHEGAKEMDKIDGNLPDFLTDTFVDAAFGTVFFGAIGAAKSYVNVAELNKLKDFSKQYLQGIGYEYVVNEKGDLKGYKAVSMPGQVLNAAKVTKAQEMADAAFYKGGLFKVPYVGTAAIKLLSGNFANDVPGLRTIGAAAQYLLGSPLVNLKISKYKAANAFADSAFDHFITTEGEAKGGTRPPSFEFKMKQTRAMLTALEAQTVALHAESNGYAIKARPTIGIQNAWGALKQKSIEALSNDTKSTDWSSKLEFMDKTQRVMVSKESSDDAAVNACAALYRKVYTDTIKAYNKAHNLPEDYYRNMDSYLSRVYNIPHMTENEVGESGWIPVLSEYYKKADDIITQRMQPIKDIEAQIKSKPAPEVLKKLKLNLKYANEKLQNELRSDPEMDYHIEDRNALSADEATELESLLKPRENLKEQIDEQKTAISSLKGKDNIEARKVAEEKLHDLNLKLEDEEFNLYQQARRGRVNPRLFNPLTHEYKDPANRLKFRKVYGSDRAREQLAKAQYDSIMNMHPADIISDMFGKITGSAETNPLKERTVLVPEELLYNNNFLTKDLYSKTANYVNFLARRTHLKTSFQETTVNGGFEELATSLLDEHKQNRQLINNRIERLQKDGTKKEIEAEKKKLRKETQSFQAIKKDMKYLYENRMMGLNRRADFDNMARRTWMSITAAANLHNLPATQITDVAFGGFQHGIWPFARDGVYPIINSLGGILKTKDSEALRKMAPSINLGYQDVLNNYADRNWSAELQPYYNMGKYQSGIEKLAHFSALTDLSPYIDNGVQHLNGSIIQANFMRHMHEYINGALSPKDNLYMRKYGIDPKIWAERMVQAYHDAGGFQTKVDGYVSKAWEWQDLEASNVFNDATFRGIQNTLVWKGMADSPFFADNVLGMFFHTFTGWGYAAMNRYVIPSLQHPDAEMLIKSLWMAGAGALVSPTRRISRGEDPWPEDMTPLQISYEAFTDSGLMSTMGNVLNIANFLSNDKLLGDLKNDKFRNRARTGIFGMSDVVSSTASRISDVLGMTQSGIDEKDLKTAAHMLPITGAMYMHHVSDKVIESMNLPRNKRAAEAE